MGTLRMRTVGGTALLALLLVLAGCSGGGADSTPAATATATETPAATATATAATATATDGGANGESDTGGSEWDRYYVFNDSEAYGYEVTLPNGTTRLSWVVTGTKDDTPSLYEGVTVNVSVGQYATSATAEQASIFSELISDGSVGKPFLYVRTPAVLAAGQDLRVGNSWTIQGEDATVGDGFDVSWETATAEITGTANVAGETCYTMKLRIPGNRTGPTSCVKSGWPFALAVNAGPRDYRLVDFDRP